jgi:hypothetical protein
MGKTSLTGYTLKNKNLVFPFATLPTELQLRLLDCLGTT